MLPEILRLQQQGKSLSEIGRLLGFTHQAIGRALCGFEGTGVLSMTSQAESRGDNSQKRQATTPLQPDTKGKQSGTQLP